MDIEQFENKLAKDKADLKFRKFQNEQKRKELELKEK